jgi:ubiquinone/menaquinone biosynthesis C-methylase UbiE
MADVYATITEADDATQELMADVLELRAADPQQRVMLETYIAGVELEPGSRVVEIGCGTGAVSRYLASLPGADKVVGVDPSAIFIERARELADADILEFAVGDGRDLQLDDSSFDLVVCHTTLCHVPECEAVIAEAHRVLRPGGEFAVFDGDYATTTVAIGQDDPLQVCADAAMAALVHDPWLMRRISTLLANGGFEVSRLSGHSYLQTTEPAYMLTIVARGADALVTDGKLSNQAAEALKSEAERRATAGTFFGHIGYVSILAGRS